MQDYDATHHIAWVEQRNHFKVGQTVEFLQPKGKLVTVTLEKLCDADGNPVEAARHAQERIGIYIDTPLEPYSMMRREVK